MQSKDGVTTPFAAVKGFLVQPAVLRILLWFAFACLLLAFYYSSASHLIASGENPLEIIRQDAGTTRLEMGFWAGYLVLILSVGFGLPWRWFRRGLPIPAWAAAGLAVPGTMAAFALLFLPDGSAALRRAGLAVLGAGIPLLAGWLVGWAALARWRIPWLDSVERRLFELLLGCGFLSLGLLALAYAGGYTGPGVRFLTGGLAVLAAGFITARLAWSGIFRGTIRLPDMTGGETWWLAATVAAFTIAVLSALAPETEFDALWYHLWLPKIWLQAGRPVDVVSEYISLYPLNWELLYGAALAWGGAVAARLMNLAALGLLVLLTFRLARQMFPSASPWLAVALLLTAPTFLWEAATAYNDLALALYCLLSVTALVRHLQYRSTGWLVLSALSLGMALAVKHLGLFFLVLLAPGLFVLVWRREGRIRPALRSAALLVTVSLLVPLPWYFRSTAASGNPFFPELFGLFGAFPPARWDALAESRLALFKTHFGNPRTFLHLLSLPWNMTVHSWRFGGTLGALFLLFIPGLLLASRRNGAVHAFSILAAGYLLLWASPLSSFQLRFLVPLVPILAVLAAEGFSRLREQLERGFGRAAGVILQACIVLLMLLNLPPWTVLQESGRQGWTGWLTHVIRQVPVRVVLGAETEPSYLSRQVPSYQAWQYINAQTPADAFVLSFMEGDQYYSERQRISANAVLARPAVWAAPAGQEQSARSALQRLGITYLLYDKRLLDTPEVSQLAITRPEFIRACLSLEFEDRFSRLYRFKCRG